MRKLFLLRGPSGCGKSTAIQYSHVEDYFPGTVISSDAIRLLFSTPVYDKRSYTQKHINGENDKQVWNFIHDLVKKRLLNGQTTVVDATHANIDMINYYKQFCLENNIECIVVQFDTTVEECKLRNEKRDFRQVPDEVIDSMFEKMQTPVPSWCKVITYNDFHDLVYEASQRTDYSPIDYNKFDKIVIFGDVHGCWEPLKNFFEKNPINDKTKYIFVGDYEDRGLQNKEVFEFLLSHRRDPNFLFLKGNHTKHTLAYSKDENVSAREFREHTSKQLAEFDKRDLKKFCLSQGAFVYFTFGGQKFLVSHAGVSSLPNSFTNERELVCGAGDYSDSKQIDEIFSKNNPDIITIHGHRNIDEVKLEEGLTNNIFNLEGKVEFGGNLRILVLSKQDGYCQIECVSEKNNVFRQIGSDEDILEQMRDSRFVKTKEMPNGITSYCFTKDCFYDKRWDNLTTKARGLFCRGNKVVARSFEKFFTIGERESFEEITNKFVYPVSVYKKENGYLGIVSYDLETKDLFVSSKSTCEGVYAEFLRNYLKTTVVEGKSLYDRMLEVLKDTGLSLVFEVCTQKDIHIVRYDHDTIFLLEAFSNSLKESTICYDDLCHIAEMIGIQVKERVKILENKEDFIEFVNHYNSSEEKDCGFEGFVLEDSTGYRVKHKTKWYRFWKFIRNNFQHFGQTKPLPKEFFEYHKEYETACYVDTRFFQLKSQLGACEREIFTFNVLDFRDAILDKIKNSETK